MLITLGIIGVVAAMTIPAVVNNTKKLENQVALKKAYATIEQVLQLMTYEEGQKITPEAYATHAFAPVFEKYLVLSKACNHEGCLIGKGQENNDDGTFLGYDFADYKTYNKRNTIQGSLMDNGQFQLRNGMAIYLENEGTTLISIDINGMYKGPNLWGHDLFTFQLMPSGKILPMGALGTSYDETVYCSGSNSSKYNGIACTNKALTDKDYWKNLP